MEMYRAIIKRHWGCIAGTVLLSILTSLSMVFAGYSLSFLYTAYGYEGDKVRALLLTFCLVMGIWLGAMLIYYAYLLSGAKTQQKLKNALRTMVGEKIASLEYADFMERDSGQYVSWLTNDVNELYAQSFAALFSGIENVASALFSLGALCLLSPSIGLGAVALLGAMVLLPRLTGGALQKANERRSSALEASTEGYKDTIMGGSLFFVHNLRRRICQRIDRDSQKAEEACYTYNITNATVQILTGTVSMAGQVILLLVTLLAAVLGATPAGAALSVGNLAGSFFNGAGELVRCFMTVRSSRPLWEKFDRICGDSAADKEPAGVIPEIRLENLSFGYGEKPVLQNKNLTFCAGGKYIIVGESGAGKTTLAKLILGLLSGYTGKIWYGSREQREIATESLFAQIAWAEQQAYLFQDTLRFNITLGEACTEEELADVLRRCCLEEFVRSLPKGLDTVVGENGKTLSGGQRQRIALARALIRKVQYVILDEGTSALDEANALEIEHTLLAEEKMGVILITHHLRNSVREKATEVFSLS